MPEKLIKNNKKKGVRKHGFLKRSQTRSGKNVLKRQKNKGRTSR